MTAQPVALQGTSASGPSTRRELRTMRVRRREQAAPDVVLLWLEPAEGGVLPEWEPGAHIDLVLSDELVRQYSLCGDPADRSVWQVAVQLAPDGGRGGSRAVFERLHTGSEVTVRGPRNAFALRPSPRYLFLAGGIGITPILPMLGRAERSGADWQLVYGGRSRSVMPFLQRLDAFGDQVRVIPQDEAGLLPLAELLGTPRPDTLVYCCGPQPLLDAVERMMAGWPASSLVLERFVPAPVAEDVRETADVQEGDQASGTRDAVRPTGELPFEVELAADGRVIDVPPGVSVLRALEQAGVPVLSSCREGTCGTCEVGVLAGNVDHRDRLLTPEEQAAGDTMLVCVSRSAGGRLVLDL